MKDTIIEGQTSSLITNLRLVIACGLGFILALALSLASLYFIDILWQQKVLSNDYGVAVTVGLPILLFFIIFKFIHAAVYSPLQHPGYVPRDVKLPDFLPLALTMA